MLGPVCALLSAACSTSKDIYSKRLAASVPSSLSTFASFAFALPYYGALLALLYLTGNETFSVGAHFFVWIALRSASDAVAESLKMKSFAFGDLSLVSSFLSLSPLFILITSPLLTGEALRAIEVIAIFLTLSGTFIISYKPMVVRDASSRRGMLYASTAALFFSLNTCFDKLAVSTASPTLSAFAVTFIAALMFLPSLWRVENCQAILRAHAQPLFIRGFFEIAFMVAKLYALTLISAPSVVGLQRVSLLLSIVAGRVVFKEADFKRRLLAGTLIATGVILIALTPKV